MITLTTELCNVDWILFMWFWGLATYRHRCMGLLPKQLEAATVETLHVSDATFIFSCSGIEIYHTRKIYKPCALQSSFGIYCIRIQAAGCIVQNSTNHYTLWREDSLHQSCSRVTFLGPDPTRPDPPKRWPDPTRDCRQKVWPDPTRSDPLPDPSRICIVFNWIIIY